MNNLSVVIPSRNVSNFIACFKAIREHEPNLSAIVVCDDMPPDDLRLLLNLEENHWKFRMTGGVKPFVFARNVNIGIERAAPDDVIVLNDDALLKTPEGFTLLQQAAEEHPEFGIIAATTNNVGNTNQWPRVVGVRGLREDPRMVCFVCVLIPRRTIDAVGLLDERFIHYGMDDDDYSLRVRNAGLKIGIHDGCFVDHASLPSSYRGPAGAGGNYLPNLEIFKEKWGMDNFGNPVKRGNIWNAIDHAIATNLNGYRDRWTKALRQEVDITALDGGAVTRVPPQP